MNNTDIKFMQQGLALAQHMVGRTGSNPAVGCVIVQQGRVVGQGATAAAGRPHAEPQALQQAGHQAKGACVYVTLEPCAHVGHTPACARTLIEAQVQRVVYAAHDPDPRVAGKGAQMLREAGIEVVAGVCQEQARQLNAGFLSRIERQQPWVTLKVALSLDGCIAAAPSTRTAISGAMTARFTQQLRATHDAIIVGSGTIIADNPQLTCRGYGLEGQSPIRVVLDRRGRTPPHSAVIQTAAQVPTWLFTNNAHNAYNTDGVKVLPMPDLLPDLLQVLAQQGINRLLLEGGAQLATQFLQQNLVDEAYFYSAPVFLGTQGVRLWQDNAPLHYNMQPTIVGGDVVWHWQNATGKS